MKYGQWYVGYWGSTCTILSQTVQKTQDWWKSHEEEIVLTQYGIYLKMTSVGVPLYQT